MKLFRISNRLSISLILSLLFTSVSFAQIKFSAGGFLGGGSIKGESTSIGSFTSSIFIETNTLLFLEVTPRLSFIYARDLNSILPNTRKPYLPYLMGFSLKGITAQSFESDLFLEEGIGLLALNDRTFIDTDIWDYGVVISLNGGWDLRSLKLSGVKIGAGLEYGLTFTSTLAQYSSFHFYFNYSI